MFGFATRENPKKATLLPGKRVACKIDGHIFRGTVIKYVSLKQIEIKLDTPIIKETVIEQYVGLFSLKANLYTEKKIEVTSSITIADDNVTLAED